MKTLSGICESALNEMKTEKIVLCDYISTPQGSFLLNEPVMSSDYQCGYCQGKAHYTPFVDPKTSDKRTWLCANTHCDVYTRKTYSQATSVLPVPKRALEWPLFCEINGIGDLDYDVKFEGIDQSAAKIDYLFKFGNKPCGIILMQGTTGSGKTYASMAVCEYFTRKNTSCIFNTQKQMLCNWLETFKPEKYNNYIEKVTNCNLLVIDDFGTGDVSPGFMSFFMDLINTRMRWSDRGTIISTNLPDKEFTSYCGAALNDRLKTGQKFAFTEKTRRKPMVL